MDGEVEQQLATIKRDMPRTYASIQDKAARVGRVAYAMVRRSLAGQPNLFYAMERGYVVGTPFAADQPITDDVAKAMVCFGAKHLVMWGQADAPH